MALPTWQLWQANVAIVTAHGGLMYMAGMGLGPNKQTQIYPGTLPEALASQLQYILKSTV